MVEQLFCQSVWGGEGNCQMKTSSGFATASTWKGEKQRKYEKFKIVEIYFPTPNSDSIQTC